MDSPRHSLFSWAITNGGTPTVLNLRGELDLAAIAVARDEILGELSQCDGPVLVDASELEFMDSTGLRLLLEIKAIFDRKQHAVTLGAVSPAVARVLDVSGIRPVFDGNGNNNGSRR